jgi:hypothetical protein
VVNPRDPTESVLDPTRDGRGDDSRESQEPPPPEVPGFKILVKLGQGGQGSVWLAEQQDGLGKRCALKVFPAEAKASYTRELEAWRRVEEIRRLTNTPHLVEGYAASTTQAGLAFVAMAFFERGSLADRLVADGPFPAGSAVRYTRHVLAALDLLHQHGLWHRDVKPQNILLGNDGIARLADYGLSKKLGATVTASCTPAFAAPEQLAGETDADGVRIDIYGVAATLFALLTGKPPVPGRPDVFLLERRKVPRPVHAPLLRALNPDPAQRFSRAADFAHALALAEPSSSHAGLEAYAATASPEAERVVHEAFTAETRAADPDRPLAATPPGAIRAPKESAVESHPATTRGRRARRARLLLAAAAGLFGLALVLELVKPQNTPDARIPPGDDGGITTATLSTGTIVDRPPTGVAVTEEKDPIALARVRGLGAGQGGLVLTGAAAVWLSLPGKTLAMPVAVGRAVPWTRERVLAALADGTLELVGASAVTAVPAAEKGRVVALAGHAASGRVAFARDSGVVHVLRLDEQDRVAKASPFRLPEPIAGAVVLGLAFDETGERLAVASVVEAEGSGRVATYSLGATPRLESVICIAGPVGVAWLSPAELAVADVDGELLVVDAGTGALRRVLPCFEGTIISVARDPSSEVLLVLGDDRTIQPEGSPGTVALGEPGEPLGALARVARKRLVGFNVAELLGRGSVSRVLSSESYR